MYSLLLLFLCRYKSGDFTGQLLTQCLELLKIQESNNVPLYGGGTTTATGNRITPGAETHEKDERVILYFSFISTCFQGVLFLALSF